MTKDEQAAPCSVCHAQVFPSLLDSHLKWHEDEQRVFDSLMVDINQRLSALEPARNTRHVWKDE